jgi:hypothetical protein
MKNMRWALAALVLGLTVAGCSVLTGEDGIVEGRLVDYNGTGTYYNFDLYTVTGYDPGFPDPFTWGEYAEIDPGTYKFNVYPYYYSSGYSYLTGYQVTYKVTAEKGGFLTDGKDKKFTITLEPTDAYQTGLKISGTGGVSETQPDGSVVFKNGAITVEASIRKLGKLPEGAVKLNSNE